uniref:PAP2_C domain-containing protein n=1 Tax=Globodera pallida TaxID=36090 RepID=A0A183BNZ1_GLOPA
MVTLSSASLILLFLLHKYRVVVIRRTLFITACLYTLRTVMMLVTQLPSGYTNNSAKCRPELPLKERTLNVYIQRTLEQTVHVGFQDNTKRMLCGDLLFSGHTLVMIVATLTVDRYIPSAFRILRLLPRIFACVGVPCMVISRTHYTCDVVIAYLSAVAIFSMYHAFCEIESQSDRSRSILNSLPLMRIVGWLEENTINFKSKNEFEFPFMDALGRNLRIERRTMPGERADKCVTSNSPSLTVAIEPV